MSLAQYGRRLFLTIAMPFALSALAPGHAFAAWATDPMVNNPVCVGGWNKGFLISTGDGAGGAIVAWEDSRTGVTLIYVQHVLANGAIAPGWPATGVPLTPSNTTVPTIRPVICSDGAGGAVIAYLYVFSGSDYDVYAERISGAGVILWSPFGVVVDGSSVNQNTVDIAPDGAGGAFVVWSEGSTFNTLDILGDHLLANGTNAPGWAFFGNVLCNASGAQYYPRALADGSGGMIAAWEDLRGPEPYALYATRVQPGGALAGGWTVNGKLVDWSSWPINDYGVAATSGGGVVAACTFNENADMNVRASALSSTGNSPTGSSAVAVLAGSNQSNLTLGPDGTGGAYVFWVDDRNGGADVYGSRVTAAGEVASSWPAGGIPVSTVVGTQAELSSPIPDGSGGAFVAWRDYHLGNSSDLVAGHVLGNATLAEGWTLAGAPVGAAASSQFGGSLVSDGAGGAIVSFLDGRSLNFSDAYAQRIERYGRLGNPEPAIASVRDVANDQGGRVRVSWNASYLDAYPTLGVSAYWLWRQVPAAIAQAALRAGARLESDAEESAPAAGRLFRITRLSAQSYYWEYVASQIANGFPAYSVVASTLSDSLPGSSPRTVFMVEARGGGNIHWDSAPDSGYSVDNLAPATPAPFGAFYLAGSTYLHWGPNHEADLAGYRLYRGSSPGFAPSSGNRIATPPDTGFVDSMGGFYFYKLSAVDSHGNESPPALAFPFATTDAPGASGGALSFAGATPNPMRGPGTLSWSLARAGHVRLAIYDLAGRRVRELVDADLPAGEHSARWDLRAESGAPVGSGLYFAVLEAGDRSLRARVGVLR
jgi:hypothetical protein